MAFIHFQSHLLSFILIILCGGLRIMLYIVIIIFLNKKLDNKTNRKQLFVR